MDTQRAAELQGVLEGVPLPAQKRDLLAYAQALGLDIRQFIADMGSPEVARKVRDDFMSGVRSGVNGTPTFFINGQRHDGSYHLESLAAAIGRAAQSRVQEPVA